MADNPARVPSEEVVFRPATAASSVRTEQGSVTAQGKGEDADEFIRIGWDGEDDPNNPKNFTYRRRWFITLVVSVYGILSPFTSSLIAPCIPNISHSLRVTSNFEANMLVSIYLLGYVVGPFVLGPMSEVYGRRPLLMASNVVFIAFNIGCSQAQNKSEFLVFRFLAGVGGSGPLSIGGGILGDLWKAEERGKALALYSIGPLLGPSVGPIVGGFIAANISWRWAFYIVIILGTCCASIGAIFLPETYAPLLIQEKVRRMQVAGSDKQFKSKFDKDETIRQAIFRALIRPIILLTTQPIIIVLTLFVACLFGTYYILLITFTRAFEGQYGQSVEIASLNNLAPAIGFIVGRTFGASAMDHWYRKLKARNGGVGTPEMRLVIFIAPTILIPTGMLLYGWTIQYKVFWVVPDLGALIFGMGAVVVTTIVTAFILDCYPLYAASALAASNSVRSIFSFGFPLFATDMYDKLGYGWGNSVLALIVLLVGGPGTLLLYIYGPKLRARSRYATEGS